MAFKYGEWRALKDLLALEHKYHENLRVAQRGPQARKTRSGGHPFQHLLNVHFPVGVITTRPFFTTEPPRRTFFITEAEQVKRALAAAERQQTRLDH